MLNAVQEIKDQLYGQGYICDDHSATILYLAETLQKPVLVEGPAGVGKTSIAQTFARARDLPLIRLQCYEGIDETRAIYEWDYKRQLLHIQAASHQLFDLGEVKKQIFSRESLLERPLLQAVTGARCCLLVDEIDKVDFEFEAMLLELLSEFQITLPELGTLKAKEAPYVFLTSNCTRELSEALKRRCLFLYLDYPSPEIENRILHLRVPGIEDQLAEKITQALQKIRSLSLRKHPSIAEGIDWALALSALGIDTVDRQVIADTLSIILKHKDDIEKTMIQIANW